jgi:hypothetical protein
MPPLPAGARRRYSPMSSLDGSLTTPGSTRGAVSPWGETRSDVCRLFEHALHDSQHHLDDVERAFPRLPKKSTTKAGIGW